MIIQDNPHKDNSQPLNITHFAQTFDLWDGSYSLVTQVFNSLNQGN